MSKSRLFKEGNKNETKKQQTKHCIGLDQPKLEKSVYSVNLKNFRENVCAHCKLRENILYNLLA